MVAHNSLHTNSKSFCTSGLFNTNDHHENTLHPIARLNWVPNLPNVLYMMLHQMAH